MVGPPSQTTGLGSRRGGVAAAVPLGGPNTSELCMWSESHHHLDGIPRNPHHLERVPGGSSGLCTHSHCNMFAHTHTNA